MTEHDTGWNGNGCEACGPDPIAPCSEHMSDAQARAQLQEWRYTPMQIEAWLAANADRPGAQRRAVQP